MSKLLAAPRQVNQLAKALRFAILLMTMPGIGPVTALTYVAAIDDISRFEHAYQVTSYVGLDLPARTRARERSVGLALRRPDRHRSDGP